MTDHDRLFKELISTFFLEFLDLFLPEVRAYVEAGSIEFLDKEIFIDVTAGERLEPDLVAKVKFKGRSAFFIVHVESQAQAQKIFPRRFFRYFARLHDRHNLPVYPIVVFSFDSPRTPQPDVYRVEFPNKIVNEFRYDVIQLNRLHWRDFVRRRNPIAAALMTKLNVAATDRPRVKLQCLRLLLTLKQNPAKMKLISGFIDRYLELNQTELREFEAEIGELEVKEGQGVMEIVTSWMKEGIKKGMQQGLEKGIQKGMQRGVREGIQKGMRQGRLAAVRSDVLEILAARFNRVPASVKKTLKEIEDEKLLKRLLREAATVVDLKAFERRLAVKA